MPETTAARRDEPARSERSGRSARSLATLALALLAVTIGSLLYGQRTFANASDWIDHTLEARRAIEHVRSLLVDAETGERGYLLTGAATFEQPFERAERELPGALNALGALTADNPVQQATLASVDTLSRRMLDGLGAAIRQRKSGDAAPAVDLAGIEAGKAWMDDLRGKLDTMDAEEVRLLGVRRATARSWSMSLTAGGLLSALALVVVAFGYRRMSALAQTKEVALRVLHDRLASAVESIQDAFALFDADDRLVLCNSVYRRFLGEALPGPVVGRTFEAILDSWLPRAVFADEAERGRFRADHLTRRHRDQATSFDVRMQDGRSLRLVDRRTAEGGTVKTIWDISDDVRVAEELREARKAAEAASAAKSEFLHSMSHELRTPLHAILGFSQLLRRDKKEPLSERHLERLDHVVRGGEHLLHLVDDVLDLAQIDSGGVSVSTEPVDVGDVLATVEQTLAPIAARQNVRIAIEAPADVPMVSADRTRFSQILENFGSNAIKYNRPTGTVTFRVSATPGRVRVTVVDTGIGIPADKQEALFQPFQRAGQESGPIPGTGIGLVITQRLARLMGGDVGFRSGVGVGSEFWVDLPADTLPR